MVMIEVHSLSVFLSYVARLFHEEGGQLFYIYVAKPLTRR